MLRGPRRQQTAERKSGNRHAFAELPRDRDVLGDGVVEILGAQFFQRGRERIGVAVPRQTGHEYVMTSLEEIAGHTLELSRARAHTV